MRRILSVLSVALTLVGCATAPNSIPLSGGEKGETARTVSIDPVAFSGIPYSQDLRDGKFVAALGTFPRTPHSFAEWDPLRIRYQAHAVGADGREYPAYAMFAGFIGCIPRYIVVVTGLTDPDADVWVVTLSTLLTRAYDLNGREITGFEPAKFQTSESYRHEFVRKNGTALGAARPMSGFRRAMDGWTVYETKSGKLISPMSETRIKDLAAINPQYGYWQKLAATTSGAIGVDYVSAGVNLVFEMIAAGSVKPQGFDYGSMLSRIGYGYNMAVWEEMRDHDRACQPRR